MTPSLNGLIALILPGVLPSIVFASSTIATTEGSFKTTPCPLTTTNVFAVPRSIAISWLQIFLILSNKPIFIFLLLFDFLVPLVLFFLFLKSFYSKHLYKHWQMQLMYQYQLLDQL